MSASLINLYRAKLSDGSLQVDPRQELAVEMLQILQQRLQRYQPGKGGGWQQLLRLKPREAPPKGLYIYGSVGRGKTMLMDLFFETTAFENKARVHFHSFMQDVHARIHRFRNADTATRDGDDPIPPVARDLAENAHLLCFDEFEVKDVADAMILGRLFTALFEAGVVVVATSNRVPDDLYKDGLNRQLFLPFIAMMKEQMDILHLDGDQDYRLDRLIGRKVYHSPLDEKAAAALDAAFFSLADSDHGQPDTIEIKGRRLEVSEQAHGVARFRFHELCAEARGAADYLALVARYHTLIIADIPQMGPEKRNEARRFVNLIDIMYDHGTKLICSAAAAPAALYTEGDGTFEFQRTVSRLLEMQAAEYVARPHQ